MEGLKVGREKIRMVMKQSRVQIDIVDEVEEILVRTRLEIYKEKKRFTGI